MAMYALFVVLLANAGPKEPPLPAGVPEYAQLSAPTPGVRLYHWTRIDISRERQEVIGVAVVDEWPEKTWGAEVEMTPAPLCCGVQKTQVRWRKSQKMRPTILAFLPPTSSYSLAFKFLGTDCKCHPTQPAP